MIIQCEQGKVGERVEQDELALKPREPAPAIGQTGEFFVYQIIA